MSTLEIQIDQITPQERYKLLTGLVVPRPIAWVSTLSSEGVPNLAPFSFFNGVCAEPLVVSIAVMRRGAKGETKDTLRNIEATGEFAVNFVAEALKEQMNATAGEYPPDINEFEVGNFFRYILSIKILNIQTLCSIEK
jgi:flavin reductase (DIM6/NTAB) family NADH-FMN oxidoreductase RutF